MLESRMRSARVYEVGPAKLANVSQALKDFGVNELQSEAESIARDHPIIFYCRSGSRSALAAAAFRQAGWDAYSLEGGLQAWVEGGFELDPPTGEVAGPQPG